MTPDKTPTDAELSVIELMKVVMQADDEARAFALRGTTNWAAYIGKAVQKAVLAKWGSPVVAGEPIGYTHSSWLAEAKRGKNGVFVANQMIGFDRPLYTTPQPTQAQAVAVPLEYARLQEISLDYSDVEDECIGFRDGWRSAEKHHGIKGGQHGTDT